MNNYDASQVGVPYTRAHKITIYYPDNNLLPFAEIEQSLAVKLADGKVRKIEDQFTMTTTLDLVRDGNALIPMVDKDTGAPLAGTQIAAALSQLVGSGHVSLNMAMLTILAVVRAKQKEFELAGG